MDKIKLKLGDILQLDSEINGYVNPETGEEIFRGFIKQEISIILKYELGEMSDALVVERKRVDSLRDDLVKKYGTEENGGIVVKMFLEETDEEGNIIKMINPKYVEFDKEYSLLLNQEKEIEYPTITKEDLKEAGKTKDNYKVLFKLIKKD
jgi:hypothetical protein